MSVFEELIEELKEQNLLEETVFSTRAAASGHQTTASAFDSEEQDLITSDQAFEPSPETSASELAGQRADEGETYRRRAMEEVSNLQMVEHVLSGIEREHMKMSPHAFDDLEVKKALHKYLQAADEIGANEHSQAEQQLYAEVEKWFSALAERDGNISVANVRRFCENSRPVLSSQALMALARFYRNSPYSEAVRGKFDFVMTRLFSRELGDEKRKLLFGPSDTLGHIQTLYSNWASLSVFGPDDQGSVSMADSASGFESFARECEAADSFDVLIASDFFNRVRLFKENTAEVFFEPRVVASAMECNVRIGNHFVDLVAKERKIAGESSIEEKYGYTYDTIVSGAASKTLLLLNLLRETADAGIEEKTVPVEKVVPKVVDFERAPVEDRRSFLAVNKWLALATLLVLGLSAGVFFWSENTSRVDSGIEVAASLNISGTAIQEHIREASTSSETLYGVMQPTWDALSEDEQKEFLTKAFDFAKSRGMKKVNLLNNRGRTVAYAAENRFEVFGPQ